MILLTAPKFVVLLLKVLVKFYDRNFTRILTQASTAPIIVHSAVYTPKIVYCIARPAPSTAIGGLRCSFTVWRCAIGAFARCL